MSSVRKKSKPRTRKPVEREANQESRLEKYTEELKEGTKRLFRRRIDPKDYPRLDASQRPSVNSLSNTYRTCSIDTASSKSMCN